ncbi:GTP-binding protein [Bradyrhizobium oligotrophicum]|uniref:GTP-binding protein n=1 Tax=Bradyrhizobium oligotrophicum TaxID=44255 RepID=UPI003EBDD102
MTPSDVKIVLFGPAHSGKSTLAGYLYYQSQPRVAEAQIRKVRAELEQNFDEAQALAYLVDISNDERRRTGRLKQGTSKRLHVSRFEILHRANVTFHTLDTPGAEHGANQRYSGILFSDAGIYCVEAAQIFEIMAADNPKTALSSSLSHVLSWSIIRPGAPLVIALTKMDNTEWDTKRLDDFSLLASEIFKIEDVVPISIDVRNRVDLNIKGRRESSRPCLFDVAEKLSQKLIKAPEQLSGTMPFVFVGSRAQEDRGVGHRILGKVMSGGIRVAETIVIYQRSSPSGISARIKKLAESPELHPGVEELHAGDLGAISIAEPVEHVSGTLICRESMVVRCGTILNIASHELSQSWRAIGRNISLLHLGASFKARIVDLQRLPVDESFSGEHRDRWTLTVVLRADYVWMPITEGHGMLNLNTVMLSFDETGQSYDVGGTIAACGRRARFQFRDQDFAKDASEAIKRSDKDLVDLDQLEVGSEGIEYLLGVWAHRSAQQSKGIAPLEISICG